MDQNVIIPALGIIFLFGAPVAAWIVSRIFSHQERMAMISRGVVPPPMSDRSWRDARRSGSWQSGVGAPPPGMVPPPFYGADPFDYAQRKLQRGISVALVGLALVIGLSFIDPGHPGPWLIGGLAPLFVGIAQIINALMCGAQFPFMAQNQSQQGSATNFGPPPTAPPPTPSGSYGWRPGPTPEIEKPASPPDQR